jgi:hypothetical protein
LNRGGRIEATQRVSGASGWLKNDVITLAPQGLAYAPCGIPGSVTTVERDSVRAA